MKALFKILSCILVYSSLNAQQTVGLFSQTPQSQDGYVLFAPITNTTTYLIDKCGKQVHAWASTRRPGQSVYLLSDGTLLRPGNTGNTVFTAGGTGGIIEKLDWNGNVTWSYTISSATECQHHDICNLPNGNILALVWELKTNAEAVNAGRNPTLTPATVWSEKIVELQPVGTNTATIVWEWHVWDHLIQDYDNTKGNFGVVSQKPELINTNYNATTSNADWLHNNSITYNAALNQILVSSHNFNEFWIIDHSTTTVEASSHSGGTHNKGGDLLYRWGNPASYNTGVVADKKLFGQHNAYWIETGLKDAGKIMVFNNGQGRPSGNYSTIDIINPPVDMNGDYTLVSGQKYLPDSAEWNYQSVPTSGFYSNNISGAQRLINGNTIICEGSKGIFFEIDSSKNTVWRYVSPVNNSGPITQGNAATQNLVFRCTLYEASFPGFIGQTLTAGNPIELNPLSYTCSATSSVADVKPNQPSFQVINPFYQIINFVSHYDSKNVAISLSGLSGNILKTWNALNFEKGKMNELFLYETLAPGMYILRMKSININTTFKLIREP